MLVSKSAGLVNGGNPCGEALLNFALSSRNIMTFALSGNVTSQWDPVPDDLTNSGPTKLSLPVARQHWDGPSRPTVSFVFGNTGVVESKAELAYCYTLPLSTRFARVLWLGGWCPRFAPINPNLGDVGRAFVRDRDGTDPGGGAVGGELCVFV